MGRYRSREKSYTAGALYFGLFLGAPRETRQVKPSREPLQLKAFSAPYGGIRSPYGPLLAA